MIHSFNVDFAIKYGEKQAIVLNSLAFWQKKNQANDRNFYDGYYWVYNSVKAFQDLFPYWTLKQIRSIFDKLEELNLVKIGNYNNDSRNRTKWYSIIDPAILQFYTLQLPTKANELAHKGKSSITLIDTLIDNDILPKSKKPTYSQDFLSWFDSYPKQGDNTKASAFKWWQKKTKKEKDDIILATEFYKKDVKSKNTKNQFILAARTFIGRDERYLDYLEGALSQAETQDEKNFRNEIEKKYYKEIQFDISNGMSKAQSIAYYIKKERGLVS